jgi:putative selenate reductase
VFEIEVEPFIGEVPVIEIEGGSWREVDRHLYRALKSTQIAIFADACNDCGNCDVFCPEDGGPYVEKPRFFGSVASWQRAAPLTGFVLTKEDDAVVLRGRMTEGEFALSRVQGEDQARFEGPGVVVTVGWGCHDVRAVGLRESRVPSPEPRAPIDLSVYLTLRLLLGALLEGPRVNFANALIVE